MHFEIIYLLCYRNYLSVFCFITLFAEKLADYRAFLLEDEAISARIEGLKAEVETFARLFPMPGHDDH